MLEFYAPTYILEECFSETSTTAQLFELKLRIRVEKGVRHGDTISPKLLTAALQNVIACLDRDDKGYFIDGKRISNLRLEDDVALIPENITEMGIMINELNIVGTKISLNMSMNKMKVMAKQ